MLKKNIFKILFIIIVAVSIIFFINNTHFALNVDDYEPTIQDTITLRNKTSKILNVISIIGTIISVIVIMIIGIKYMFGSLEEKAEYKKTIFTYLIGAVLLFGATVLPTILYKVGTSMFNEDKTDYIRPGNIKPGGIIMKDEIK